MADDTILPTTFVYGPRLINNVPIGIHSTPVSLSSLMTGHSINLSPTSGVQHMFLPHPQSADNEQAVTVSSPINSNPTAGQKRQRRSSATDKQQNVSTVETVFFLLTNRFFLTNTFLLMCKKIQFCINFHRFFLTIGYFLPFSAARNG